MRREIRSRAKIAGTGRPRLSVFRSLKHISAQIIDDAQAKTLVSVSHTEIKKAANGIARAEAVGQKIAEKALAAGIKEVVFDKGRYKYHGQVKALADGARSGGLTF